LKSVFLAFAFFASAASAGVVSDSNIGYSITLPANWSQLKLKPVQHYFRDSTKNYHSQISILKYDIDPAVYPSAASWTQAQFIAYKTSVETSAFPFGAVAYYDRSGLRRRSLSCIPRTAIPPMPSTSDIPPPATSAMRSTRSAIPPT
jgi:hypothetical protein